MYFKRAAILYFSGAVFSSCVCSSIEPGPNDKLLDFVLSPIELADTKVPHEDKILGLYSGRWGYYLICESQKTGKKYRRRLGARDSHVVGMWEEIKFTEGEYPFNHSVLSATSEVVFVDDYSDTRDMAEPIGKVLGNLEEGFYLDVSEDRVKSVGIDSVFLYDITKDGVPEVWLLTEGCEADRMVLVYSLSDWGKEIYQDTAGHSMFYTGDGYVLRQWAHMGHASWYRLRWDGKKMVSEKVFEEDTGGDYSVPSESLPILYEPEKLLELIDGITINR